MSRAKRVATREKAERTRAVIDPHDHLRRVDAKLAEVIERVGPCPLPERASDEPTGELAFRSLVRAIVSQQLSGKAADTIYGRLEALFGGALFGPAEIAAMSDERLRSVGLSAAKTRGVKDLAARVLDGSLDLGRLHAHDDDAIVEMLTRVKGIGRWTAEMFLMFRLGRPDVLSTGDLGLRKGLMTLLGLGSLPDPATMERLTAHWRPFRSVGSWYLWRVAESAPPLRAEKAAKKGTQRGKGKAGASPKTAVAKRAVAKRAVAKRAVAKKAVAKKAVAKARA